MDGAGYETAIKGGALAAGGKPKSRPASKPGTKKVRLRVMLLGSGAEGFFSGFVGFCDWGWLRCIAEGRLALAVADLRANCGACVMNLHVWCGVV